MTRLRYFPSSGCGGWARTSNDLGNSQALYQLSYTTMNPAQKVAALRRVVGLLLGYRVAWSRKKDSNPR